MPVALKNRSFSSLNFLQIFKEAICVHFSVIISVERESTSHSKQWHDAVATLCKVWSRETGPLICVEERHSSTRSIYF
jgi:hypothetical protein